MTSPHGLAHANIKESRNLYKVSKAKHPTPATSILFLIAVSTLELGTLQLLRQSRRGLLRAQAPLEFCNERGQLYLHAFFLRVALGKTHLLDADLASLELVFAEDDAEGDAALLGGFELLGQLGLQLV